MAQTALKLTEEEFKTYKRAAKLWKQRTDGETIKREERAWELAHAAAKLLRERFGASRVVVFGSLVHKGCFTRWSDVDIAAWGLDPKDTFRAIGAVQDLDTDIEINLVDVATCSASLLSTIEKEGVDL